LAVLGLVVSVACVVLVLSSVDIGAAIEVTRSADLGALAIGCAFILGCVALRWLTWRVLLPPRADGTRVPVRRIAPVVMVGLLGNSVLPARLGEVIRAYLISQRERISLGGALGSILLERIVDTSTLAILAFAAAMALGVTGWVVPGTALLALGGASVLVLLMTLGLRPLLAAVRALASIPRLHAGMIAIHDNLEEFVHWSGGTHRRGSVAAALGISLALWSCNAAMFLFIARALGVDLPPEGALLVMAVTVLATAIPSAPAYVGTYELAAVAIMASMGVGSDVALAIAILTHVVALVPTLVGGAIGLASIGMDLGSAASAALSDREPQAVGDGRA
jgi:uncharacterized protein (TIRG00374 family)